MSYQAKRRMIEDPDFPPPQGAFPVWSKVFTRPGERTFLEITTHPDATAKAAYIWVFLGGALSGLINSMLQFIIGYAGLQQLVQSELGRQLPINPGAVGLGGLIGAICAVPSAGAFAVFSFTITTGIVHATARFFGGQGSYDRMAYAFGAIVAPVSILSALLIPVNAIPFAVFCTGPLLLALSLYVIYLEVAAIKAVHGLGWGESIGALVLPGILIALLCGVLFLGLMQVFRPQINEIMQQIQQLQQMRP